ncbi:hypothetical protein [Hoyosella subflava]|uniref:Uncharacterized protein n=1 Tax=Hoyosella subflava (strain DSM 45089 / JCM 17490 / NBRC 109087 / DQS3-9A1) TaxID=443218 RepID=F6EJY8_HOYSD|nr:hypothetical protein [Hoyosella subflava]AEF41346.1 hypothetical protein AS9A_2899 [Hoyosella subflava DQS3-9A1]
MSIGAGVFVGTALGVWLVATGGEWPGYSTPGLPGEGSPSEVTVIESFRDAR